MFRTLFRFLLISISLVLLLSYGPSMMHPLAQSDPSSFWDEGQPHSSEWSGESPYQTFADPNIQWEEGQAMNGQVVLNDSAIPLLETTPGTFYRTYSGTRFSPTSSALTYNAAGGAIYATALPVGGFSFSMDFDLPAGAAITEVVFFVIDNDPTNINLSLRSYNPETDSFMILKSAATMGASPTLQTIVIPVDPPIQVDNTTTSYRLRVAPGVASANHLLRGARIGYTIPQVFLPAVAK